MAAIFEDVLTNGTEARKLDTGKAVKEAALELFSIHGYPSVSLRQLAESVGIQVGSLYNHMENKQELLFELIEEAEHVLLSAIRPSKRSKKVAIKLLECYVQCHLRFIYENRCHHVLATRDSGYLSQQQLEMILAIRNEQVAVLQDILTLGNSQNTFSVSDVTLTTGAIRALLEGVFQQLDPSNLNYTYAKDKIASLILCVVGYKNS